MRGNFHSRCFGLTFGLSGAAPVTPSMQTERIATSTAGRSLCDRINDGANTITSKQELHSAGTLIPQRPLFHLK